VKEKSINSNPTNSSFLSLKLKLNSLETGVLDFVVNLKYYRINVFEIEKEKIKRGFIVRPLL
jgi:hypothetical protein